MRLLGLLALALCAAPAAAEQADSAKPTQIEANRMQADDVRRLTVFEGNVVVTRGTLKIDADRIVVHQDAEGFSSTRVVCSSHSVSSASETIRARGKRRVVDSRTAPQRR